MGLLLRSKKIRLSGTFGGGFVFVGLDRGSWIGSMGRRGASRFGFIGIVDSSGSLCLWTLGYC
jgi:hypothetical protein